MMRKRMMAVIVAFGVAAASLTGCGGSSASTEETSGESTESKADSSSDEKTDSGDTIEFAVMGPMTGDTAGLGQQQEYGVRLAVEEINENGGVDGKKLEYDVYDDQMNTNQAVICAEKMAAAEKYRFIVTSISTGCSKAAYPTWVQADLPVLSGINTGNTITELGYKNYLRICAKDSAIIEQMCDYMVKECGVKKPAIIYSSADTDVTNFEFTTNYLKENYDIDVVDSAQVQVETEKDYSAYITNFKGKGADAVYMLTEYNPAGLFLKQKYSLGWDVPVFGNSGCANPLIFEVAGNEATDGFVTMSAFDAESSDERTQKFVESYRELTDTDPGQEAAGAYDLIYMMATALENEETKDLNGNDLVEWLRENAAYEGIMVNVDGFDENGDNPAAAAKMLIAKDGKYTSLQ